MDAEDNGLMGDSHTDEVDSLEDVMDFQHDVSFECTDSMGASPCNEFQAVPPTDCGQAPYGVDHSDSTHLDNDLPGNAMDLDLSAIISFNGIVNASPGGESKDYTLPDMQQGPLHLFENDLNLDSALSEIDDIEAVLDDAPKVPDNHFSAPHELSDVIPTVAITSHTEDTHEPDLFRVPPHAVVIDLDETDHDDLVAELDKVMPILHASTVKTELSPSDSPSLNEAPADTGSASSKNYSPTEPSSNSISGFNGMKFPTSNLGVSGLNLQRQLLTQRKSRAELDQAQQTRARKAIEVLKARSAMLNQAEAGTYPSPSPLTPANPPPAPQGHPNDMDHDMIDSNLFVTNDESDDDSQPSPEYLKAKKQYELRKELRMTTVEDDVAFRKLLKEEELRANRVKSRHDYLQREPLDSAFVNTYWEPSVAEALHGQLGIASEDEVNPAKRPSSDKSHDAPPNKRAKKQPKANKIPISELRESMAVGMDAEVARGKKKKVTRKSKKVSEDNVSKVKEPKKRGRPKRGPEMTNIRSLYTGNTIADATANRNAAEQPKFSSKNKSTALSELIASIPEEERKTASADKNALLDATKKFNGVRAMRADGEGGWRLKGMKSSLYHYQLLGAAFMRDRENGTERPYGGFQADEMGFGKTVMMIANMLDGRPGPDDPCKTTLIVATPTLAGQWMSEIARHVDPGAMGEVIRYSSGARIASSNILATLQRCDVIITTYNEVRQSYPHCRPPLHLVSETQKNTWWANYYKEQVGPLHKIYFRRIVLDEAQAIKNAESKTSIAVRGLNGQYRWAISGTPIQNAVDEFYPYFRFLKVKHTGSIDTFRQNYVTKNDTIGMERLHGLLRTMMIRRTHLDTIFGRPILKLPDIEKKTIEVEFNQIERTIYEIVKKRFCLRINSMSKAGILDSSYRHIFAMMLALRQLTGSILLVQRVVKDILTKEDINALWLMTEDETDRTNCTGGTLKELGKMIAKYHRKPSDAGAKEFPEASNSATPDEQTNAGKTPPDTPVEDEIGTGNNFGVAFKFSRCLRALRASSKWDELNKRSLCHQCGMPPEDPVVTDCLHLYCRECLERLIVEAASKSLDRANCKECGKMFDKSIEAKGIKELEFFANSPRRESSVESGKSKPAHKEDEDADWISVPGLLLPSAKTMALKMQVLHWMKEDSSVKIIVFTQFLDMVRIISRICSNEGWGCCTFTGQMNFEAREKAIKEFRDDPHKQILIASLKAGGIGLNLTMASKVIILDLYWNECVESQAFCRVFRIGQEKEVEVIRFVVKNSIDEDMVRMQERKTKEIDQAIGDSGKSTRYTVQELLRLFGPVREDDNGHEFIWVQDEDEEDEVLMARDLETHLPPRPF